MPTAARCSPPPPRSLAMPASPRAQAVHDAHFLLPDRGRRPDPGDHRRLLPRLPAPRPGSRSHPVYAGNYSETLTKAPAAIHGGQGPQLAVLLAAEMHSLQEPAI